KSRPAKSPGPVLMLDDPDEELESEKPAAEPEKNSARPSNGSQLLGGMKEPPKDDSAGTSNEADPFADDEEEQPPAAAKNAARQMADDDVEEAVKDNDSPPARLPQPVPDSKPKPVATDPFKDDGDEDIPLGLPAEKEKHGAPERKPAAPADADDVP